MSSPSPAAPSAKYHCVDAAVTPIVPSIAVVWGEAAPIDPVASVEVGADAVTDTVDRSARTGCVACTATPKERFASPAMSLAGTASRSFAPRIRVSTTGSSCSRKNVKITSVGVSFGFVTDTTVCDFDVTAPSAKYQSGAVRSTAIAV